MMTNDREAQSLIEAFDADRRVKRTQRGMAIRSAQQNQQRAAAAGRGLRLSGIAIAAGLLTSLAFFFLTR